jgi:hypothetical protein
MLVAGPAKPDAEKDSGLPASPSAVAMRVLAPAVVPSVHEVSAAMPFASETTAVVGRNEPPPTPTEKETATPATGFPAASRTRTDGAIATALPATAVCA